MRKNEKLEESGSLLEDFKGWDFCNWESFPKNKKGHNALVHQLVEIVKSMYRLKFGKLDEEECIAWRPTGEPIFAHNPDLIIQVGSKSEDRIFIEYVNTKGRSLQNFIRDLRGMLALSAAVKRYRGFVLAIRDSIYPECYTALSKQTCEPIEPMSLKSLLFALDKKDYDWLVERKSIYNDK